MGRLGRVIGKAAAAAVVSALLSGVALAANPHDPGSGTPPGNSGAAPGQVKKETTVPVTGSAHAATGKQLGHRKPAGPNAKAAAAASAARPAHPVHPVTPAVTLVPAPSQQPAFAAAKGQGHEKTAHHKVIICHRTGSATNPYVVINISINAWQNGHSKHPALDGRSDILLKDPAAPGEKLDVAQCGAAAAAATSAKSSVASASGPGTSTPAAAVAASGVKGVSYTLKQPAKGQAGAGGVLGALTTPAVSGQLPFTGLPLWSALLLAAGLLVAGLGLRAATRATA